MLSYFRQFSYSITAKLLSVFICTAVLLIWVLWVSLDITFERKFSETIHPYFSKYLISLQKEVGFPPDIHIAKRITESNPVQIVIEAPTYRWSSNSDFIEKPYLDIKIQKKEKSGLVFEVGFYKGNFILRTFHKGYITSFIITEKFNTAPKTREALLITAIILIVIGMLYVVIYYLFHPIKVVERGIKRIGDGDVSYRLDIKRKDEIGSLSQSVNKMANNIEMMLAAKRQLLLAVSHELRTPITRAKIALSLMSDSRAKDSISEDMQEMENLIQELLESEKLRFSHAPLEIHSANINEIIYQVQGKCFEKDPIELQLATSLPNVEVDASRIGLAIKNLIKNALMARKEKTDSVMVKTTVNDHHITIQIIDYGIGIAADKIPHLTEPFYRIDKSRQRRTGGFGIGLYLIKAIVEAHKARLMIDSELGKGTTVSILLPLNRA